MWKAKTSCVVNIRLPLMFTFTFTFSMTLCVINIRFPCVLIISVTHPLYVDQPQSDKTYQRVLCLTSICLLMDEGKRVQHWQKMAQDCFLYISYTFTWWSTLIISTFICSWKLCQNIKQYSAELKSAELNCYKYFIPVLSVIYLERLWFFKCLCLCSRW